MPRKLVSVDGTTHALPEVVLDRLETDLSATFVHQGSVAIAPTVEPYVEIGNAGSQASLHITAVTGFNGPYLVGIGNDAGTSTALLVANKANGPGLGIHNESTTGAGAFGLFGIQESTAAPLVRLEMGAVGSAPLLQMTAGPAAGAEKLIQLLDTYGIAGEVNATDGRIAWQRSVDIRDRNDGQLSTLHIYDREGLGTQLQNHHWNTKQGDTYFGATGSPDMWFAARTHMDGATLKIQGGGVAGSANPAAPTYATVLAVTYDGRLGFFDAAPVAKPTGVAVTAAGIHAALVSLGLIAA